MKPNSWPPVARNSRREVSGISVSLKNGGTLPEGTVSTSVRILRFGLSFLRWCRGFFLFEVADHRFGGADLDDRTPLAVNDKGDWT
jgi:hypothetical protein